MHIFASLIAYHLDEQAHAEKEIRPVLLKIRPIIEAWQEGLISDTEALGKILPHLIG